MLMLPDIRLFLKTNTGIGYLVTGTGIFFFYTLSKLFLEKNTLSMNSYFVLFS